MVKTFIILALTIFSVTCQFQTGFLKVDTPFELKVGVVSSDDVIKVFDGFFTTVGAYSEMPAFAACKINDFGAIKALVDVVNNAINKNYSGIITSLSDFTKSVWKIYSDCDNSAFKTQLEQTVMDIENNFGQPDYVSKVVKGVQTNMLQIMAFGQNLYNNYTQGQFEDFGKNLGSLARLVLVVN